MAKWICKRCEAENDDSAECCVICGSKRDSDAPKAPVSFSRETIVYCDENGNSVDSPEKASRFLIRGIDDFGNPYERVGYLSEPVHPSGNASDFARTDFAQDKPRREADRASAADASAFETAKPAASGEAIRESMQKSERKKRIFRLLIVFFVIVQYVLYLQPYSMLEKDDMIGLYAIYYNVIGVNGPIEQICSLLLVLITILPAILCWIEFRLKSRNLPVAISAFVSGLTTIYCLVILFGSVQSTVVPVCIILCSLLTFLFTVLLVRTCSRQNEAISRPKGF